MPQTGHTRQRREVLVFAVSFTHDPAWRMAGPLLVVSRAPARIRTPGALYRDTVWGRFRLSAVHANATPATLDVGVAVDNPAPFAVRLSHWALRTPGAPTAAIASRVLAARSHLTWVVPLLPGQRIRLDAGGSVRLVAPGLLGRLAGDLGAPVVVTVFAAASPPGDPLSLADVPARGGVRATFPHAWGVERVTAPLSGTLVLHPGAWHWPSLPGVDAVDGVTTWSRGATAFAPRLDLVLPATRRLYGWRVVEGLPGRPTHTVLRLRASDRGRKVVWRVPGSDLGPGGRLILAPVPRPAPRP